MKILHLGLCVQPEPINGMQKAFINNCEEYRELNCGDQDFNQKAVQISNEFKPDLVFIQIQAANIITPHTVNQLRGNGAYVMNWTGDVRDDIPGWMIPLNCNITLFSNMRDVNRMRELNFTSDYLEIGYDPEIYNPVGAFASCKDIVFFGNNYGHQFPMSNFRNDMVNYLKGAFGDKFGVYGTGWKSAEGNFNHSQRDECAAYRSSKIAINCSHYEIERYSSDRLLRILGTGVPICLAKWYPGIEKDFQDYTHLRVWKDLNELEVMCKYYLSREDERAFIAKNGNELAKQKFTFDAMVKNIIKLYNENK